MLTAKERQCLVLLWDGQSKGLIPSYEELTYAMNLKSKSGINRIILALDEKEMIVRMPSRARAITVTKAGEIYLLQSGAHAISSVNSDEYKMATMKAIIRQFSLALSLDEMHPEYEDIEVLIAMFNKCKN